jgi:RND family efflux transporter MFP subunit
MKKLFNLSKKRKIIIAIVGILVVVGIIIGKGMLAGPSMAMTEAKAVKQDLTKYYSFSGNIESSDVQNVVSTTNEPVKKFYVKEGNKVKVGDLLYEVDSNTIQSTLTSASTSLSNAKTAYAADKLNYERKNQLYEMGGVTLEELQTAKDTLSSAQNQVAEAQASYAQAQKQYADTKCDAEVSGEVSKIYVDENDSITQGTSIMDIINYDSLEVNIKVDEYDLAEITEGMNAEVYIEAIGKTVTGTISEIARGASVENGVSYFETTVTLPQDTSLRVGLSAEVKVVTQSAKNVVTVPVKAIVYEGSNAYVQRRDSGKLERVPVTVGINNGTDIEIKKGLNAGDSIVYTDTASSSETTPFGGGPGAGRHGDSNNSQNGGKNSSQNGSKNSSQNGGNAGTEAIQ